MTFYLCACSVCLWKGNKMHLDGQCPVCGHGLDIKLSGHREEPAPRPSKLRIRGLSIQRDSDRTFPAAATLTRLRRMKIRE